MVDAAPSPPDPAAAVEPSVRRRRLPLVLITLASVLALVAIFAVWANRQLLDTENWTETSSELLEDEAIRSQVGVFLVDQLYANVDVQGELELALPPRAQPLAAPAARAFEELALREAGELLGRPLPQALWEGANRRAHGRFMEVVEGGGENVSTEGGDVTLDLRALLVRTAERVGLGEQAEAQVPEDAAQLTILHADGLELAQDVMRLLRAVALVLVIMSLGLFALAVYLARGWRRQALRACGVGFLFAGAAALVARSLAGDAVVDALASTEAVRPAAEAAWSISTSLLVEAATAAIASGAVIVGYAWLAGPTGWAVAARRGLAPYLRRPSYAYGTLAIIVLVLLAWGPIPATRRVIPALVLVALLALGLEALRRQTAREFPAGVGPWAGGTPARASNGPANGAGEADRLEQLERLGKLREAGVLDASEFEREKAQIIAATSATGGGQV